MTLTKWIAKLVELTGRKRDLERQRSEIRKRDKELTRAIARLELAEHDMRQQMLQVASASDIQDAVKRHNMADDTEWDSFVYFPKPEYMPDSQLLVEFAAKKLMPKQRRHHRLPS